MPVKVSSLRAPTTSEAAARGVEASGAAALRAAAGS
jgi:hypothetical protein